MKKFTFQIVGNHILVLGNNGKTLFKVSNNVNNAIQLLKLVGGK